MRAERVCSLARHVLAQLDSLAHTAANQWLERTLDDSAVRRLALPEMFLATDGLLELDDALRQLAERDRRKADVLELHFFGGLGYEEIAGVDAPSVPTRRPVLHELGHQTLPREDIRQAAVRHVGHRTHQRPGHR